MNREQKAAVVEEIAGQIEQADAIFAVDYRGLSVPQAAQLRLRLRDADATFRIVKNSLSERAVDRAGVESLKPLLEGPTALTLIRGDAALAAKALSDVARSLRILEFKGGLLNGNALSADDIRAISQLPAREVLHAQLVGTVAAPITGLVRGLNALVAGIAIQLQALADQGLVGAAPRAESSAGGSDDAQSPDKGAAEPAAAEAAESEAGEEGDAQATTDTDQTEQDTASDADESDAP